MNRREPSRIDLFMLLPSYRILSALASLLAGTVFIQAAAASELRLSTLDPGHFHAALFYKGMLPGVSETVHVYAPLGPDLLSHLNRLAQFNSRVEHPTHWLLEVHAGPNPLDRLLAERAGDVVVLSGRNLGKIERITALARAGLHVLADKPWIIDSADFPKLETGLSAAAENGVAAFDAMTERFEITYLLQRALVNDPDVFGQPLRGGTTNPAVCLTSLHYLFKEVAGVPALRPAWFFDIRQQGEGLADVGTHLVDLVQWTLFPNQALDYRGDIEIQQASRSPVELTREQFQRVTGEKEFPAYLRDTIKPGGLEYFANDSVNYTLRGISVRVEVRWEFEAPPGQKESQAAVYCGSRSRIEVLKGRAEGYRPEVYAVPNRAEDKPEVQAALQRWLERQQATYPGLAIAGEDGRFRLLIPEVFRVGHEDHFALLVRQFLGYARAPQSIPSWEKPNMLAKYFVTTQGVKLARQTSEPAAVEK